MSTGKCVRLLVASKNPTLRQGVKKLLESDGGIELVAETKSVRQTVSEALRVQPDFILMDADMAGLATLSGIRRMKRLIPNVRIWVCSLWEDGDLIGACLAAGANGSLSSSASRERLLGIVHGLQPRRHVSSHGPSHAPSHGPSHGPGHGPGHGPSPILRRAAAWIFAAVLATGAALAQDTRTTPPLPDPQSSQPDVQLQETVEQAKKKQTPTNEPQEEEEHPELRHLYFTSPFSASAIRETRISVGQRKVDDHGTAIGLPEITIANVLPKTEFFLSYHPTLEIFNEHKELNASTQIARLRFAHELSPRWVIAFRDSFLHTEDPTRVLDENIFLLPRTRYRENVLSVNLDYLRDSRTKYSLDFDNTISFLDLKNLIHIFPADRFDQVAGALTASVVHKLEKRQRLTGSYSFLLFRDLHLGIPSSWRPAHNGTVAYEYGWDQRGIYLEASGGVLHENSTSYTALARIGYNWRRFALYTGYTRQFAFIRGLQGGADGSGTLSGGLTPESIAQIVSLDFDGTVAGHLVIGLHASAGKGASALQIGDIKGINSRIQLAYRIGRVFPFVSAEFYGQNFNPMTNARMDRSRYAAGFAVSLDSIPEAANTPAADNPGKWPLNAPGLAPKRTAKIEKGELK